MAKEVVGSRRKRRKKKERWEANKAAGGKHAGTLQKHVHVVVSVVGSPLQRGRARKQTSNDKTSRCDGAIVKSDVEQ